MPDRTNRPMTSDDALPTAGTAERGRRFPRRLLGYDRPLVDASIEQLAAEVVELRGELMEAHDAIGGVRDELSTAQAELRYWHDRQSYVEAETERVRAETSKLEEAARERAEAIEQAAQERSLKMIDRVCVEANVILQHAREEAKDMFARCEDDMADSRTRTERMAALQFEVASAMRKAMRMFEQGLVELDRVAPSTRLGQEILPEPEETAASTRREAPTFGRARAIEAAAQFDEQLSATKARREHSSDGDGEGDGDGNDESAGESHVDSSPRQEATHDAPDDADAGTTSGSTEEHAADEQHSTQREAHQTVG